MVFLLEYFHYVSDSTEQLVSTKALLDFTKVLFKGGISFEKMHFFLITMVRRKKAFNEHIF